MDHLQQPNSQDLYHSGTLFSLSNKKEQHIHKEFQSNNQQQRNIDNKRNSEENIQLIFGDFKDAIKRGDEEKVQELLEQYPEYDLTNKIDPISKQISIFLATLIPDHHKSCSIIKLLFKYGVNAQYKDSLKQNCAFYLSREGNHLGLELLLANNISVDDPDNYGQTPLYYASREGKLEAVKVIHKGGANLNHIDNISKQTALFYAAREGQLEICKYLVENGCDFQVQDLKKQTAINYAKKFQRKSVVEYLQQLNLQLKDKKKQSVQKVDEQVQIDVESKGNVQKKVKKQSVDQSDDTVEMRMSFKVMTIDKQVVNGQRLIRGLNKQEIEYFINNHPNIFQMLVNPDTINSQEFRNYVANDKWEITAKKILNNVWRLRGAYLFHQPVDYVKLNILDYYDIIHKPMDFATIKFKINNYIYVKPQQFIEDMKLVFSNCILYNGINSDVGKVGRDLHYEFVIQCQKENFLTDYDFNINHQAPNIKQMNENEDKQIFMQDQNNL